MKRSAILRTVIAISLLTVGLLLIWTVVRAPDRPQDDMAGQSDFESRSEEGRRELADSDVPKKDARTDATSIAAPDFASNLPAVLATAVGIGEHRDFASRLEAISNLGTELSDGEIQALYTYLRAPAEDERWLRPGQSFALKNDVMNILREQETPPDDLTDLLVFLWRDESQQLVMRDYSLQHLAPWYSKVPGEQKKRIVRELSEASGDVDQSYAGTALIALVRIQNENPGVELAPFTRQIEALVRDGAANLPARITAVQLSAVLGVAAMYDPIRLLALDESQPKTLRMAALAGLSEFGREVDISDLLKIAGGKDPQLAPAARGALKKFQHSKPVSKQKI